MTSHPSSVVDAETETRIRRKIFRRLIPLLMVGYFVSYIDRANISFAKPGLTESFGITGTQFGFAAGIFFIGYVLFEIPSNFMLTRVGARKWLSRIMLTWGIVSICMVFVTNIEGVYWIRFLLGAAEAGFFPGIIFYLTRWFPNEIRARMISTFMLAVPLAIGLGSLLNGYILSSLDGVLGIEGWRWLFVVGGVPSIIIAFVYFFTLPEHPKDARWLKPHERDWLVETIAAENEERKAHTAGDFWSAFKNKRVWVLALVYFLIQFGFYPLIYWLPAIVGELGKGLSSTQIGLLSAVPFLLSAVVLVIMARKFSRRADEVGHITWPMVIGVIGLVATALTLGSPMIAFIAVTAAIMAGVVSTPMFWSLPTSYLGGAAAAAGIALINSLGNIAGFASPYAVGWVRDLSAGNNVATLLVLIAGFTLAIVVLVIVRLRTRKADL